MEQPVTASDKIQYLTIPWIGEQVRVLNSAFEYAKMPVTLPTATEASLMHGTPGTGTILVPKRNVWHEDGETGDSVSLMRAISFAQSLGVDVRSYIDTPDERYRLTPRTAAHLSRLDAQYSEDAYHVQADMGPQLAGHAPMNAENQLGTDNVFEACLDPYTVLMVLLVCKFGGTLKDTDVHFISCPGAQYDYDGKGAWLDTPRWDVVKGVWRLDWNFSARARDLHVNAMAILPR